ncbi:MAG: hypothetical protein JJU29_13000 [Verrucomicrobia bacterium]|nr:hypothetical protein [Verrucomicrobiota bacterium]
MKFASMRIFERHKKRRKLRLGRGDCRFAAKIALRAKITDFVREDGRFAAE